VTFAGQILTLNCGSSSIKFALFNRANAAVLRGQVEGIGTGQPARLLIQGEAPRALSESRSHAAHLDWLCAELFSRRGLPVAAVGHRVVHGGDRFDHPVVVDATVHDAIAELAPLAPSHQPHNLAGIDAMSDALPGVPQVACFDTAFHLTIPEHRRRMPLPQRFDAAGLRRFGFHGLSYEGIVAALPALLGERASGRVIACHLGNGCSLAGIVAGKSQYTSMGFTPLDGLMMGRRPGRLDPGAVLWLVRNHGGDVDAVDRLLNQESGLAGVSGISPDMRTLLASDEPAAKLAVEMFVDRLVQEIGAAAAAIGGIDALVFAGGIGENAAPVRARTIDALAWLGFRLDQAANAANARTISAPGSVPTAHVVPSDEEAVIAKAVAKLRPGRATTFV
jgi:acetate kinase